MPERVSLDENLLRRVNTGILQSILREGEKYNLKQLIKILREYLNADMAYWLFLDAGSILSVVYDGKGSKGIHLSAGLGSPSIDIAPLPKKPARLINPVKSVYGDISFSQSLRVPLIASGAVIAFVEFGVVAGELSAAKSTQVIGLIKYLHNIYESLYEDMLRFERNRKLRSEFSHTERLFRILSENTHDLVLSADETGHILSANDTAVRVLGLAGGKEEWLLDAVNPALNVLLELLEKKGIVSDMEVMLKTSSGAIRYFIASFTPEMDSRNAIRGFHGIFKDITERVEAQNSLWQTNLELAAAKEELETTQSQMVQHEKLASIGQLAAGIAHEINNPLGFIMSNHETVRDYVGRMLAYISFLEKGVPSVTEIREEHRVSRALDTITTVISDSDEGFSRITKIIQSLKDFSRVETRGEIMPVHIDKLIEDTLVVSRNNWKYVAEVSTRYELEDTVEAYGDLLNQVFMNIIVNAAQAIAGTQRDELGHIYVHTWRDGLNAVIRIEDDGPGIPEEVLNRIFDPFFTTKPIGQGTGLGLSVSYDIVVKKHKGRLIAENRNEGGARFTICIPITQDIPDEGESE